MTATMRALRLEVLHPRAVLALAAGRFRSELYHGGAGSPLRLVDAPAPDRPAGWVRVRPTLSGICGSDLKLLKPLNGFSPTITALAGMPRRTIPGHGSGYNAVYGGGWAEQVVAPAARVHPVPDDLGDTEAVLTEPMAVAVQAVGRDLPPPGAQVLVIGPGTLGNLPRPRVAVPRPRGPHHRGGAR